MTFESLGFRISDVVKSVLTEGASKGKGKGKSRLEGGRSSETIAEILNKSMTEMDRTLSEFKDIMERRRNLPTESQSVGDVSKEDYGHDITFNMPSRSIYYENVDEQGGLEDTKQNKVSTMFSPPPETSKPRPPQQLEDLGKDWLLQQCENHLAIQSNRDQLFTAQKLCTDVFTILRSDRDDDEIQNALVDLLGYDNFEFTTTLITHRQRIVNNIMAAAPDTAPATTQIVQAYAQPEVKRPSYGAQVLVQSEEDKKEMKMLRKEQKKAVKAAYKNQGNDDTVISSGILGFDAEDLRKTREDQLRTAKQRPLAKAQAEPETYPNVYQSAKARNTLSIFGTQYALPSGTVREDFKDYEEISVPITKKAPIRTTEKTIMIKDMDNLCKGTFEAYKSLNRIQSIVYPVAYETNENILMCAPTGAGKTDVAMLTVLRCIYQYCTPTPSYDPLQSFHIAKTEFKIVYVAPMKALAAEVVEKMGRRLSWLGIKVRELTGDMQLTKDEIVTTQMIVTTPEKWDVVTRKSTGDTELAQKVKLLIIDEVHLLHEDRGSVIESIIARTLRQVESSQSLIRIVGLSATLPNYVDVAHFLRVNPYHGLFYFDGGFRPVPLEQHFLGIKGKPHSTASNERLDRTAYQKVIELVKQGHQVMVFVHARKETVKTAFMLKDAAAEEGMLELFDTSNNPKHDFRKKDVAKSRNKELKELFNYGFGCHHAGMLRSDRSLTEKLFAEGFLRVLCCTATLAWGVNLPAYAVVIKGTQIYDASKGNFMDLSILDVLQIFGRAGRPQYEDQGVGYILTTHDKLSHYVSAMTQQHPIESRFIENMVDNLNAEISLGTVSNVDEAVSWLSYTYLFVRMKKNPLHYGMDHTEPAEDPLLGKRRRELIISAARKLHKLQMIIFDENTGYLSSKDLGRISSNFYISHKSVEIFNECMKPRMTEADALAMISLSSEFDNIKSRENEAKELTLLNDNYCACTVKGGTDSSHGKTNILLQSYISKAQLEDFALVSDCAYVAQNAARVVRALFEIALNRNWGPVAYVLHSLGKSIEKRMWSFEHPLRQFGLPAEILMKLENMEHEVSIVEMRDMDPKEIGHLIRHTRMGTTIAKCVDQFPLLQLDAKIAPITRNVLRIELEINADFIWSEKIHGGMEPWWIWAEDNENNEIYYSEYFILTKKKYGEPQKINFTIPLVDPVPPQIYIRAFSDRWMGAETLIPVSFKHLIRPQDYPPHTDLLDLQPLPISALHDDVLEEICAKRFSHFNPVQTQIFHALYHTSHNALIGAPTGSGKTVAAELAMWWAFRKHPGSKVVYIAPMKALVRERVDDWNRRLTEPMQKKLVELTGDVTPDLRTIESADIIITTPEKWDGISRSWQSRSYVRKVSLVIIDEIHLLGTDRGPILEVIVSRMNYISSQLDIKIRIVGLSTALANAHDLADWLGIQDVGLYNFRHSVRPVPLEVYIDGFSLKAYCPRMQSMNKPAYAAIKTHSPNQPVIIFVSSRRQTALTAQDLIAYCGIEDNPRRFLTLTEEELEGVLSRVVDPTLKNALSFGIGFHHAGLTENDRKISEELFVNQKIQILVATSTLAWGVNFPAHLVIIKGTEYWNYKIGGYQDFPITDILQMMGRAGRPQYDNSGIARIFVHDSKKNFFKKFLHEPFPVESSLHLFLHEHINAEIASGTIKSKQDAMDYLTWTYFFRRLQMNPTYYGLEEVNQDSVEHFLSQLIEETLDELTLSGCLEVIDDWDLSPTAVGKIASYYYLQHKTMRYFTQKLGQNLTFEKVLAILTDAEEYEELPIRHNEDMLNIEMEKDSVYPIPSYRQYFDPHTKAFLLLQAHFSRAKLPITDFVTDSITALDQAVRISQAAIDTAANAGFLSTSLTIMNVLQCIKQARWFHESSLLTLPGIEKQMLESIRHKGKPIGSLVELTALSERELTNVFKNVRAISPSDITKIIKIVNNLPIMDAHWNIDTKKNFLLPNTDYTLNIHLNRLSRGKTPPDGRIYAPKFTKAQYESWWLVLGDTLADELLALKRVNMRSGPSSQFLSKTSTQIQFVTPERLGKIQYTLFLMSDGYLGLDQQIDIEFEVRME